jgi:class 3 adenylate cyclase/tetratricopeptide (TPR) repeat protein
MAACGRCGEDNPERARFCLACGAALGAAPKTSRQERKFVSVLFVDLVSFTSRSDRADPEDVRDLLERYHARSKGVIESYGGIVEKFVGDAVMAVFGAPVAHSDDAERAVRAGLAVLGAIIELNRDDPALGLEARAAVNTGEALVAVEADSRTGEALAMGDVVNTAARLQPAAPRGRLVVGEPTYRATRASIAYDALPPIEAKGKRDLVAAWLAIEPLGDPAERPHSKAAMVGRDREMALLSSLWRRAIDERRPHLLTVLGPPGIGKSRLHREFAAAVKSEGGRVVRGRCLPYEERAAYGAFGQQVRELAGIAETDAPEVAYERLEYTVARFLPPPEAGDVGRHLAVLIGVGGNTPLDRTIMFYAGRRFIEAIAQQQPTLLVFEDVHWAGESQLDLVEYLAARVRDMPVLFVAAARPELLDYRPTWGSGMSAQTTLMLEPLSPQDATTVAMSVLSKARTDDALERLVAVAGGNPLFVEELTAALAEAPAGPGELPATIRAAIAARIDTLPPDPRAILLDASVVGKSFWRGALAGIGSVDAIDEALDELEQRDFIRREPRTSVAGEAEFAFKHILIRDVAYGTLPRASRRERHAAVARFIEGAVEGYVPELQGLLAYHWREADEPERAIEYLLLAAERAKSALADAEAMDLFEQALTLADDETARHIRLQRGLALVTLEDYERGASELEALLPELDAPDRLEALVALGRGLHWTERTSQTIEVSTEAIELAEHLDAADALAAATGRLSLAHAMRGEEGDLERAIKLGERSLHLWVPGTRREDFAELQYLHGHQHYWTGSYERALELARAARAHAVEPTSVEARLRGAGMAGLALAALGRYEEAIATANEAIAVGRELGRPVRVSLNYSTAILRDLLDLEEARARSEESLEGADRSASFHMPWMNAEADLIQTELLAGEFSAAKRRWEGLFDKALATPAWERWYLGSKLAVARAEIALEVEGPDEAIQWALDALGRARRVGRRKYEVAAQAVLGRSLLRLNRTDEALHELRSALSLSEALGSPPGRWRSKAALSEALAVAGDDDGATAAHLEAIDIVREIAASLSAERAGTFLAADPVQELLARAR